MWDSVYRVIVFRYPVTLLQEFFTVLTLLVGLEWYDTVFRLCSDNIVVCIRVSRWNAHGCHLEMRNRVIMRHTTGCWRRSFGVVSCKGERTPQLVPPLIRLLTIHYFNKMKYVPTFQIDFMGFLHNKEGYSLHCNGWARRGHFVILWITVRNVRSLTLSRCH